MGRIKPRCTSRRSLSIELSKGMYIHKRVPISICDIRRRSKPASIGRRRHLTNVGSSFDIAVCRDNRRFLVLEIAQETSRAISSTESTYEGL
jgi:hypothetical protein